MCRNSSLEAGDAPDQLAGGALRLGDLAFQLAPPVGGHVGRLRLALEAADQLAQVLLDRLDVVFEAANDRWISSIVRSSAIIPFTTFTRRMTCDG